MRPVAVYSALRVGLFLACLLLLRVLGVSGLLSVVFALLLALLLSFLVLRRQRDAVTRALMERRQARGSAPRSRRRGLADRLAEDAAAEDAAADRAAADRAAAAEASRARGAAEASRARGAARPAGEDGALR